MLSTYTVSEYVLYRPSLPVKNYCYTAAFFIVKIYSYIAIASGYSGQLKVAHAFPA